MEPFSFSLPLSSSHRHSQDMVVTPDFHAWQSDGHVYLQVELPNCPPECAPRAVVDGGNILGLACGHAYLPLVFADGSLCNGSAQLGQSGSEQDVQLTRQEGSMQITLRKARSGQHVAKLDSLKPSVFPIEASGDAEDDEEERLAGLEMLQRGIDAMKTSGLEDEDGDGRAATTMGKEPLPHAPKVQQTVKTRIHECFDDSQSQTVRRQAASQAEERKWDEGMYLDSFVDQDGEIAHLLSATLPAPGQLKRTTGGERTAPIDETMRRDAHLLLLELLLAQSYDHRTTLGDPSVESSWTIASLSRTLTTSCMPSSQEGDTVHSVLCASIRRQLCYGLYRNWSLSLKVAEDVSPILLKLDEALLRVQHIILRFEEGEDDVLQLYIKHTLRPMLYWFDALFSSSSLHSLAKELDLDRQSLSKSDVSQEWDLELLEEAAKQAIAEGEGGFV